MCLHWWTPWFKKHWKSLHPIGREKNKFKKSLYFSQAWLSSFVIWTWRTFTVLQKLEDLRKIKPWWSASLPDQDPHWHLSESTPGSPRAKVGSRAALPGPFYEQRLKIDRCFGGPARCYSRSIHDGLQSHTPHYAVKGVATALTSQRHWLIVLSMMQQHEAV